MSSIQKEHFKVNDIKIATELSSVDCFMGKLDLSAVFHLVNMIHMRKRREIQL